MKHLVFAEFDDRATAEGALEAVRESYPHLEDRFAVIDHPGQPDQDAFPFSESEARRGMLWAGALGAGIGALVGVLLVWPLGVVHLDLPVALIMGAGGGLVYAALHGLLAGAGNPHHDMNELAEDLREGQVLLTLEARTEADVEQIGALMEALGAVYVGREGHVHGQPHGPRSSGAAEREGEQDRSARGAA